MINRAEIKQRSKAALSAGYWMLVITVFIAMVLGAGIPAVKIFTKFSASDFAHFPSLESLKRLTKVFDSGSLVNTLLIIFVTNVVSVGLAHLCMKAYRGETVDIADLFAWFREGRYLRAVAAMALYELFVVLGFMCFVIPGIVVLLGLSQIPYIIAEDDTVEPMDAVKRSWEMMKGHKGELLVFFLSFFGWMMLSALTFGVLHVLYVGPYMSVSFAGWHIELSGGDPVYMGA
ncbi:MAG: DUF975 family protein [Clostridia bacterium]|nr:DUF975 family protein [Clostridia bacterium]